MSITDFKLSDMDPGSYGVWWSWRPYPVERPPSREISSIEITNSIIDERCARAQSRPFRGGLAELSVYSGVEERPPLTVEESPPFQGGVLQSAQEEKIPETGLFISDMEKSGIEICAVKGGYFSHFTVEYLSGGDPHFQEGEKTSGIWANFPDMHAWTCLSLGLAIIKSTSFQTEYHEYDLIQKACKAFGRGLNIPGISPIMAYNLSRHLEMNQERLHSLQPKDWQTFIAQDHYY